MGEGERIFDRPIILQFIRLFLFFWCSLFLGPAFDMSEARGMEGIDEVRRVLIVGVSSHDPGFTFGEGTADGSANGGTRDQESSAHLRDGGPMGQTIKGWIVR